MPDLTFTIGYLRVFGIVHGIYARLAQSAERKALNLVVVGSGPTVGVIASVRLSWARLPQTLRAKCLTVSAAS